MWRDYTIQSTTQELGNKPVDTRYNNGEYIKNTENMPVSSIKYDDLQKEMEDILSPYMHKDSQNSGFWFRFRIFKNEYTHTNQFRSWHLTVYNNWEDMFAALGRQSSSNQ